MLMDRAERKFKYGVLVPFFKTIYSFARNYRVTVVGGASEVGQALSLMLRTQPSITRLHIHDTLPITPGVILDLSHIPAESTVTGYIGEESLDKSLKGSDVVIAAGGSIHNPEISKDSVFDTNTNFIKMLASKLSKTSPLPFVGILTEPVNTLVPLAAEILKHHGDYNQKKLFGITSIDHYRVQDLYSRYNDISVTKCVVPVIGGRSEKTAVPLISQAKPACEMSDQMIQEITMKFRKCDENILMAKKGCSSTLLAAYSGLMFTRSVIDAFDGKPAKVAAFIENNDFGTGYFSGIVHINHHGVTDMERFTNLSKFECYLLERSIEQIRKDVLIGKKILEVT
ncbi:hypothetical protein ACJJTC_017772 [Scirpophaga incertulas]